MMRKPEHPPLTLVAITEWLQAQPHDQEYIWQDPTECMVGHYLRDHGSSWGAVMYSDIPHYHEIAAEKPWTFGAALERAKTLALPPPHPAANSLELPLLTAESVTAHPESRELVQLEQENSHGREPHAEQKDRAVIGPDRPAERQ